METTIQKWGNSLAVRLPKGMANKRNLVDGSAVTVVESKEGLLIRKVTHPKKTLAKLIAEISPSNVHGEVAWGAPQGNEVW
jgi:antitoxin MazE